MRELVLTAVVAALPVVLCVAEVDAAAYIVREHPGEYLQGRQPRVMT
jgi:hypothetical protein